MKLTPMNKAVLALSALLLTALPAQARSWEQIKQSGTIKIATEGAFPPFNYFKGSVLSGFEVDLAVDLARQLGVKVQWVTQPFDNLLIGLNQDRYDFVIASHGITAERQKAVDFSDPHYCTGGTIVSRPGGPRTAAQLAGKTVAVQVGTSYLQNVQKLPGVSMSNIKTFPKDTDALAALMASRVDAWVTDKFVALDAAKAQKGRLQVGDMIFQERIAMAVKKGNSSLLKELNASLAKVQNNGEYARLSNSYFGTDIRCK